MCIKNQGQIPLIFIAFIPLDFRYKNPCRIAA